MKKALAVLIVLTFSAAILSYYSGIINWKLVDVRGFPRISVQIATETSLINPTSHAPHDRHQTGSAEDHTSDFSWKAPREILKIVSTATQSATRPAGPATLPDVTTEVPQDRTHTRAPEDTDTPTPAGSPTASSPEWSSPSITQRTTAPQTTTSVNPGTSSAPGSPTASSPEWSSPSITQRTMTLQSVAGPTTLRITTQTTPSSKQTSLTTSGSATSAKGKTTRALPTAVTHHITATTSSTKTTVGPTLAPQPSAPQTGNYLVYNGSRACLRADMGVQLLIEDKKTYFTSQMYFNLDPNVTQASGNCGPQKSNLLLTFPGGFVNLTFAKVKQSYHIVTVEASLTVSPSMNIYSGRKDGLTMFETKVGYSFKCVSEQSVELSSSLQLHTTDVQLQAFDFDGEHFGNVNECTSDYAIMVPMIVLIVIPLCIVILVFCGIRLRKKSMGYQRI